MNGDSGQALYLYKDGVVGRYELVADAKTSEFYYYHERSYAGTDYTNFRWKFHRAISPYNSVFVFRKFPDDPTWDCYGEASLSLLVKDEESSRQ